MCVCVCEGGEVGGERVLEGGRVGDEGRCERVCEGWRGEMRGRRGCSRMRGGS